MLGSYVDRPHYPGIYASRDIRVPEVGVEIDFVLRVSERGVSPHHIERFATLYTQDLETVIFRAGRMFGGYPKETLYVYVYNLLREFEHVLERITGSAEGAEATAGLYDPSQTAFLLRDMSREGGEKPLGTFIHEFVHALQRDAHPEAFETYPLWLLEGMAEFGRIQLLGDAHAIARASAEAQEGVHILMSEVLHRPPSLDDVASWEELLTDPEVAGLAYALAYFVVEDLVREATPAHTLELFRRHDAGIFVGESFEETFAEVFGRDLDDASRRIQSRFAGGVTDSYAPFDGLSQLFEGEDLEPEQREILEGRQEFGLLDAFLDALVGEDDLADDWDAYWDEGDGDW